MSESNWKRSVSWSQAVAAMTMDLYGHLIDQNLWDAAARFGGTTGARTPASSGDEEAPDSTYGV